MIHLVRRPGEAPGSSSSKTKRSTPSVRRCVVEFALVATEPKVFELPAYVIRNRERVASEEITAVIWDGRTSYRNQRCRPTSTLPSAQRRKRAYAVANRGFRKLDPRGH